MCMCVYFIQLLNFKYLITQKCCAFDKTYSLLQLSAKFSSFFVSVTAAAVVVLSKMTQQLV